MSQKSQVHESLIHAHLPQAGMLLPMLPAQVKANKDAAVAGGWSVVSLQGSGACLPSMLPSHVNGVCWSASGGSPCTRVHLRALIRKSCCPHVCLLNHGQPACQSPVQVVSLVRNCWHELPARTAEPTANTLKQPSKTALSKMLCLQVGDALYTPPSNQLQEGSLVFASPAPGQPAQQYQVVYASTGPGQPPTPVLQPVPGSQAPVAAQQLSPQQVRELAQLRSVFPDWCKDLGKIGARVMSVQGCLCRSW